MQTVVIVTKPSMEKNRVLGKLISYLEDHGLQFTQANHRMQLSLSDIKYTYSLMGIDFCDSEEQSWEIGSGYSFVLTFIAPDAHKIIDTIAPQKHFSVIYIKKDN